MLSTGLVVVRVRSSARGQSQPARCESSPAGCPQRGYPQGRWQRLIGGDGARTVCPRDDQTCRCCRGNSTSDIHQRKLCPSGVCHSEPTPNRLAGRHNLPRAERRRRASPSRPTRRRSVQRFWRCTHRGGAREDSLSRVHRTSSDGREMQVFAGQDRMYRESQPIPAGLRSLHREGRSNLSRRTTGRRNNRLLHRYLPVQRPVLDVTRGSPGDAAPEYVQVAQRVALDLIRHDSVDRRLGRLLMCGPGTGTSGDDGWRLVLHPNSRPDVIVEYRRTLLPLSDPDKSAELSWIIFATSLREYLLTKLCDTPAVDGW